MNRKLMTAAALVFYLYSQLSGALGNTLVAPASPFQQQCQDMVNFATQRKIDPQYISFKYEKLEPFNTDSLLVIKDGKIVYEWYDGINAKPESSHILWSASKDITGLLIARTIQDGFTFHGNPVTLNSKLEEFFPFEELLRKHPQMISADTARNQQFYEQITIDHLLQMSAGFEWQEFYDKDLSKSSFMPMLYTTGRHDMSDFALQVPMMKEGPGNIWNYSGGNANILMAILEKIHGDRYKSMPWDLLFNPLGMTGVKIERDASGKFIGSSYIYMTTRDFAKVGQLLLQKGQWQGKQLLPPTWTQESQEIAEAILKPGTTPEMIKTMGAASKRIFWLNQNIYREDGQQIEKGTGRRILNPQEMPQAPGDMYFAAGHYGQLLIMIPSHNTVIVRTGANAEYWDHIQPLAVKALACVDGYQPPVVEDLTPPSAIAQKSFFATLFQDTIPSIPSLIGDLKYVKRSGIASGYLAKEICSYLYTSGVYQSLPPEEWLSSFKERLGFSKAAYAVITANIEIKINAETKSVQVGRYTDQQAKTDYPNDPASQRRNSVRVYLDQFVATQQDDPRDGCNLLEIPQQL